MKSKLLIIFLAGLFLSLAALSFGATDTQQDLPLAMAPEPIFEFKPVLDGDEVVHDFIIQNKGTAELKINRVRTG